MITRQNTNNPCPSNALADLNDNTITIDEWVNSTNDHTIDRFGNQVQTKHKILNDFRNAVDRIQRGSFLPISSVHTNENGVPTYMIGEHVVFSDMVGDHRLMPFRANELPFGWYFRNGDNYLLSSPQGQALNSLSDNYKNDHRITIKEINGQQYINVPTAFHSDGRGFYERAVDGTTRQVGSIEDDAIREIWGHFDTGVVTNHDKYVNGAFLGVNALNPSNGGGFLNNGVTYGYNFKASNVVPTGPENKVLDIGMTPAIFLGV